MATTTPAALTIEGTNAGTAAADSGSARAMARRWAVLRWRDEAGMGAALLPSHVHTPQKCRADTGTANTASISTQGPHRRCFATKACGIVTTYARVTERLAAG